MRDLILKQAGLEHLNVNSNSNNEVELTEEAMYNLDMEEIAGMESYMQGLDLTIARCAVNANDEMGEFVLENVDAAHYNEVASIFGIEALVDVAQRQYYKVKQVIMTFIRAVLAFVKRMLGMATNIKKLKQLIKTKAKAYKKKFDKESGKITLKDDGSYTTKAKSIKEYFTPKEDDKKENKHITSLLEIVGSSELLTSVTSYATAKVGDGSSVNIYSMLDSKKSELIKMFPAADKVNLSEKDALTFISKLADLKLSDYTDKLKDSLDTIVNDSVEISAYRTAINEMLEKITGAYSSTADPTKDLPKIEKQFRKLELEVEKVKEIKDVTPDSKGGIEKFMTAMANMLVILPTFYTKAEQQNARVAEMGFTEVDKFLGL